MKHFFLFLVLSVLLFACKKDELAFQLEGNIKSTINSSALEGVSVRFYVNSLGGGVKKFKSSTKTDGSGHFNASVERNKFESLVISVEKNLYFKKEKVISFSDLTTDGKNTANFSMNAESWTKFILKNNQPQASDELKILKNLGKTDCNTCCPNTYSYYTGAIDTSFLCPNNGNQYMRFHYWVNGNESHELDSVYNTPFDTVSYTINY